MTKWKFKKGSGVTSLLDQFYDDAYDAEIEGDRVAGANFQLDQELIGVGGHKRSKSLNNLLKDNKKALELLDKMRQKVRDGEPYTTKQRDQLRKYLEQATLEKYGDTGTTFALIGAPGDMKRFPPFLAFGVSPETGRRVAFLAQGATDVSLVGPYGKSSLADVMTPDDAAYISKVDPIRYVSNRIPMLHTDPEGRSYVRYGSGCYEMTYTGPDGEAYKHRNSFSRKISSEDCKNYSTELLATALAREVDDISGKAYDKAIEQLGYKDVNDKYRSSMDDYKSFEDEYVALELEGNEAYAKAREELNLISELTGGFKHGFRGSVYEDQVRRCSLVISQLETPKRNEFQRQLEEHERGGDHDGTAISDEVIDAYRKVKAYQDERTRIEAKAEAMAQKAEKSIRKRMARQTYAAIYSYESLKHLAAQDHISLRIR